MKRTIYVLLFIVFYFIGIRNVRSALQELHMGTILPDEYGTVDGFSFYSQSSVSYTFIPEESSKGIGFSYKIPFGVFFLISVAGLISIKAGYGLYFILIGCHFIAGVFNLLLLSFILDGFYMLAIPIDLVTRYILPLISLSLVALGLLKKQNKL